MNEKDLLLAAIDDYPQYTKSQKIVLKTIASIAVNDLAAVSVQYLSEQANVTKTHVYLILKKLQADHCINIVRNKLHRSNLYKLNNVGLDHLIQVYNNKKSYKI